jgi:hypothetical protein
VPVTTIVSADAGASAAVGAADSAGGAMLVPSAVEGRFCLFCCGVDAVVGDGFAACANAETGAEHAITRAITDVPEFTRFLCVILGSLPEILSITSSCFSSYFHIIYDSLSGKQIETSCQI